MLEVPGHIRGKAGFEPKPSVTRVCALNSYHAGKWEVIALFRPQQTT